MKKCEDIVKEYLDHVERKFQVEPIPRGCKVITAYRNLDNDAIVVYVMDAKHGYRVTDLGYAVQFLFLHGIDATGPTKRAWLVDTLAKSYNVSIEDGEITAIAKDEKELPGAIERVVDALRSVSHVTFALKPQPYYDFREEVTIFLQQGGYIVIPDREYRGRAEVHRIPIVIRLRQDVLMHPLSATSQAHARALAERVSYQWIDLHRANVPFSSAAVVNDAQQDHPWTTEILRILQEDTDFVGRWSEKGQILAHLTEIT